MTNRSLTHRIVSVIGFAIVGLYTLLDLIGSPLVRPLARFFVESPPVDWCRRLARRLPAYGALVMLAVPLAIAEPAKVYGLYLIGDDKLVLGIITIVVAYLMSLLLVDTIYDAARPQLRSIVWFAVLVDWVSGLRQRTLAAVYDSRAWRQAKAFFIRMRRRRLGPD